MHCFLIARLIHIRRFIYLLSVLVATAKQFHKKLDPQLIMTDFEPAIEKAIRLEIYFSSMLSIVFD